MFVKVVLRFLKTYWFPSLHQQNEMQMQIQNMFLGFQ